MTTSFRRTPAARLLTITLCIGALAIAGCNKTDTAPAVQAPASPAAVAPSPAPAPAAPAPAAYTPPSAEQLYQLVAPIALYPDKLVAQVLAGSTYPDQITAAHGWLAQNAALRGGPLADAANQQPWDPSVKSLTAFRPVLDQMAGNIAWTEALGQAYYNDPADVMNAIQVMRQRASAAGRLKNNNKLRVASAATPQNYTPAPDMQPVYAGPAVIEPPPQLITSPHSPTWCTCRATTRSGSTASRCPCIPATRMLRPSRWLPATAAARWRRPARSPSGSAWSWAPRSNAMTGAGVHGT